MCSWLGRNLHTSKKEIDIILGNEYIITVPLFQGYVMLKKDSGYTQRYFLYNF